jgi:spectrin beta
LLASNDYGRDEDSVQTLMKKLEGIERELNTFQHTLERLAKMSRDLINRSHFDSENILRKQVKLIKNRFKIYFILIVWFCFVLD